MSSQGLFGSAVSGARWIGLSKVISTAFTWASTILVMRILHPEDYGLVAMGGVLTILAAMILDAGLGAAFVQRRNISAEVYKSANTLLVCGAIVAVLVVQILARPMAGF